MPTNTVIFKVNDRDARAGFNRLKREVDDLDSEFKETRSEAERAGQAIDRLGDEARQSASAIDRLGNEARDSSRQMDRFGTASQSSRQGIGTLTRSLGGLKGGFAGLGIAVAGHQLLQFGIAAVQAAGQMEGLQRGLEAIEGSNADERLRAFNEIAKLPGLNTPAIIRYSNALRSAGATTAEVDALIVTFGQSIVGLGGTAADTSRAMLQLTQAFGENRISQENFSTIKELIPSFNRFAQEIYNTNGSMDDLNQTFKDSGQTLGQFLLPVLAKLREEIPAAPVDSYARSIDALAEEFQQFKIAIGTELLPVVSATARGLASLFDTMTKGVQVVSDFFDVVDEQHNALLNASESAREFAVRLTEINTATGQREAVDARIANLQRLQTALRKEQAELSDSSDGYLEYAERIRTAANEIDLLRSIQQAQSGSTVNQNLIHQRTQALETATAEIQRYETALARAREEAVGETNPAIQQLERFLASQRTTAATLTREIELLKNGFQEITTTVNTATEVIVNYSLTLAKLRGEAENTYETLSNTPIFSSQLTPNFQAAIDASNAYYDARIQQAEAALAKETANTEAYNTLETQVFELRRQRIQQETRLRETLSQIRIQRTRQVQQAESDALQATSNAYQAYRKILNSVLELQKGAELRTYIERLRQQGLTFQQIVPHVRTYAQFLKEITALQRVSAADAQYGTFTSQLRKDFQDAEAQGRTLLTVMREIAQLAFIEPDLDARIPDPDVRQQEIDQRIAAEVRGAQILNDVRQEAGEQGRRFLNRVLRREERDIQRSVNERARTYRQFANLVSNTFVDLATGRVSSFEQVAAAFIQQSLRIVLRAFVEFQIQKRLDDTLTASKIANINKIAAAQSAAGAGGLGNLAGLGNLSGLGRLGGSLSGGGLALGAAALLFPTEIRNLTGGITDTIGNLLDNVASVPDNAFGAQQVFLKIGDNETREITDLQESLRNESRV